jgi:type I restriction enzyme S subunit
VAVSEKASYPSVTDSVVKCVSIPLPPLDIQREIVAKLEAVKAQCERLKTEAERGLKAAEALRKAVLAEAFEQ